MGFSALKGTNMRREPPPKWKRAREFAFFGLRPITMVAATVALAQGMNHIADLSISYLYKDDFGLGPVQVSFVLCFTSLPWMIKPLWGLISDNIVFFGYKRKSYLILLGLLECFYYFSIATWVSSPWIGILMLILIQVSIAFNNVIGEALLVESAQEVQAQESIREEDKQAEASKNVSLFFGVKYFGVLSTAYLGGYLLEYIDKHTIFLIAGTLPMLVVAAGAFIMNEKPRNQQDRPREVPYEDIPSCESTQIEDTYALQEEGVEHDTELRSELNIFANRNASTFKRVIEFVKKPAIFRPIIFLLLFMITPSCSSAMFYFYTNELNFSPDFLGQLKFANSVAGIIGIYLYNRYLKNIRFDKLLTWSTILCVVLGLSQILLVLRWNGPLGIPDKIFCIGDSVIIQSVAEINYLPVLVLACRMCPKNLEGTMYALLMATLSFGGMLSTQLGGIIAYFLNVTSTDFSNLWLLIAIANITMLLPLPFLKMVKFENIIQETEQGSDSWIRQRSRKTMQA